MTEQREQRQPAIARVTLRDDGGNVLGRDAILIPTTKEMTRLTIPITAGGFWRRNAEIVIDFEYREAGDA